MRKEIIFALSLVSLPAYSYAADLKMFDPNKCYMEGQKNDQTKTISLLNDKVDKIKRENVRLRKNIAKIIEQSNGKISNINFVKIKSLEDANKELQITLSKVISQSKNKVQISNTPANYSEKIIEKNAQIANLKLQINDLYIKYNNLEQSSTIGNSISKCETKYKSTTKSSSQQGIELLKAQNQSLRDTIRAQSHSLVSADNATKTSERLLTENKNLQRQVDQKVKLNKANVETASDLIARNNKLQKDVLQRDNYINKMLGMCDDRKNTGSKNNIVDNSQRDRLLDIGMKGHQLKSALDVEKENNSEQLKVIHQMKKDSDNIEFKDNISYLEKGIDLQIKELGFLMLRSQELNARVKLLLEEMTGYKN